MKDLEEIWDDIELKEVPKIETTTAKTSRFELDVFRRVLKVEMWVAVIALVGLMVLKSKIPSHIWMAVTITSAFGLVQSALGFYRSSTIALHLDNRTFIKKTISFLRLFSLSLKGMTFFFLLTFGFFFSLKENEGKFDFAWFWASDTGSFYTVIFLTILALTFFYTSVFYQSRIKNLKRMLEE